MFERVSADDLMSLASGRHPPPLQVGAVLILDVRGGLDVGSLRTVLQQRIAAVPRLRQRLEKVPLGCGRPVWVDDSGFNIDDHLRVAKQQSETDDAGLLDIAANLVTKPLPRGPALVGRHLCSCPDRRPRRSGPRHAPRRGSRVGRIGRSPRARRRLTHAPAGSPTTASKPSRAGKGCLERPHSLTAGAAGSARPAPLRPRPRSECSHRTRSTFSHPELIFFPPWWRDWPRPLHRVGGKI